MDDVTTHRRSTFICSRGTLDGAYPSLVLGINTARMRREAYVFYTFMGINILRKGYLSKLKFHPPGFLGAMPGMSALATSMMKKQIEEANIPDIEELMEVAQIEGVRLVACHMTMGMMKLTREDLIDGVEIMTAEEYLKLADGCHINMFT
ncbi:MAG: DsrE/DsrF/DrsH-like family protein [Thermodesulfobacteriota bacterium]